MEKKSLFGFMLVMAVIALPLGAQTAAGEDAAGGEAVFAPFVSRFQGEVRNNLVRLSWLDSPDVLGPVFIYRSTLPFEGTGPFQGTGIRPVEVPYGVQSYVDELETGGTVYYFAAASDEMGRSYDIPISFTNTISIQIAPDSAFPASAEPAERSNSLQSGISSLGAEVQGDRVIITFREDGIKSAALYRSARPINQTPDLLGAVIVQTKVNSPFTDYPVPGIPYYYAVVAEEDLVRGGVDIIPGRNATRSPVIVSAGGTDQGGDIRAMPLPQMSIQAAIPGMNAYNGTPPPAQLSPEAAKALGNPPGRPQSETALKKPRAFTRDMQTSPAGDVDDYALSTVVKGSFTAKNWENARDELVRFLALPRSPEITARARFYLGQCYYFLRQSREGLFEFLAIQDKYPAESMEWIQASLDMLKDAQSPDF